jgi:hypothetical protein
LLAVDLDAHLRRLRLAYVAMAVDVALGPLLDPVERPPNACELSGVRVR